jgi:uncharacterized protein YqeY
MTMNERVDTELAAAMRARDPARLSALRLLKTALTNRSIERGHPLSDAEALQVVQSLARQRHDSIEQFGRAGRTDLVEKERAELAVLDALLPPAAGDETLAAAVDAAIAEVGATSARDIGRVMKAALARLAGQTVDGRRVNELVRSRLGQA